MVESSSPILVISGDEHLLRLVKRALGHNHIHQPVRWVQDGLAAIDYLQRQRRFSNRKEFHLQKPIVLDLRQPSLSGFEVLEWVKTQPKNAYPLLVISSQEVPTLSESPCLPDGNPYFAKLSPSEDLEGFAAALYDYWMIHCLGAAHATSS